MYRFNHTYRIVALPLAFLMLFTSVGFSADLHYCQGHLKSISVFGKAKNCHEMAKEANTCPHHQKKIEQTKACSEDQKDCCENKVVHIQLDQDQQIKHLDFTLNQALQQFAITYLAVFFFYPLPEKVAPQYNHYRPPPITRDIPVLLQSFLL